VNYCKMELIGEYMTDHHHHTLLSSTIWLELENNTAGGEFDMFTTRLAFPLGLATLTI